SAWSMVALVAAREVRARLLSKVFVITSALFVVGIVGGGAFLAFFGPGDQNTSRLGLTSEAMALEQPLRSVAEASGAELRIEQVDPDEIEQAVRDDDLDAVVSGSPSDVEVTVESEL